MNIILCGLPMCGKTVIGKMVAEALKWQFIDTDRLIERAYNDKTRKTGSCREIFKQEGDVYFRALEREQIGALSTLSKCVIAVGGGSLTDPENGKAISTLGHVVYLKADPNTLWKRMRTREIPAYLDPAAPEQAFYTIASIRMPMYEALAATTIATEGLGKDKIVEVIIERLQNIMDNYGK